MAHHFITTAAAGIFLVWPEGECYWSFRNQFVVFCAYLSKMETSVNGCVSPVIAREITCYLLLPGVVQVVQFYYQSGILYRLRALGVRNDMDTTLEGFHSWMFKGFSFLLPFLFIGYVSSFFY